MLNGFIKCTLIVIKLLFCDSIMPESVLWLYHKGNIEDATKILNKMAKYNGVKVYL